MKFEITENYSEYSLWLKIWEIIRGFLTIFFLPFSYGKHLVDKIRGINEPEPREQNVWQDHVEFKDYKVESLALSNEESTQLFESETLDFPDWKDWDDPFGLLLKIRTLPEIAELNNSNFLEVDLKTKEGLYIFRINKKGEGMTLCLLPSDKPILVEVMKLKSLSWTINSPGLRKVELLGFADKGKYHTEIKLTSV